MFFGLKRKEVTPEPIKASGRQGSGELRLGKWHALGNDFLFLDLRGTQAAPPDLPSFVRRYAERHFGFGCDQVIIIEKPLKVRFFNADGSEADFCGNALKCVAKMLAMEGLKGRQKIEIKTGIIEVELSTKPASVFLPEPREVRPEGNLFLHLEPPVIKKPDFDFNFKDGSFFYIDLGNPHYVGLFEGSSLACESFLSSSTMSEYIRFFGGAVQREFPATSGVNVGFCFFERGAPGEVYLRVFERGVGETLSCGSGAVACALALRELFGINDVKVFARGNILEYSEGLDATLVKITENAIIMQGSAVKTGEILITQTSSI